MIEGREPLPRLSAQTLDEIWQMHEKGCMVCYHTVTGPCTVAVLVAEVHALKADLAEVQS